jgi:hypothetical protein
VAEKAWEHGTGVFCKPFTPPRFGSSTVVRSTRLKHGSMRTCYSLKDKVVRLRSGIQRVTRHKENTRC